MAMVRGKSVNYMRCDKARENNLFHTCARAYAPYAQVAALTDVRSATQKVLAVALAAMFVLVTACALSLSSAEDAYAEGSKDLVANGGYRPYTERYNASTAGEDRLTEIFVYAKEGEVIQFGTSVKGATAGFTKEKMGTPDLTDEELAKLNQCDVVVCDPDWVTSNRSSVINGSGVVSDDAATGNDNPHAYPYYNNAKDERISVIDIDNNATAESGSAGYIGSCAQESAGPGNGGYTPKTIVASKTGVYMFKFYSKSLTINNPHTVPANSDAAFTPEAQAGGTVAAWDITVQSEGKNVTGRVFTTKLFLNIGSNVNKKGTTQASAQDVLKSNMYAVTSDNYHYKIDFNGMDPFGFVFFANNRGLLDDEAGATSTGDHTRSLYHSVRSDNNQLSDLADHGIILNNVPTKDTDQTYKLFFNDPSDVDVLAALGINSGGASGDISDFKFTGNGSDTANQNGGTLSDNQGWTGCGGIFSFNAGATTSATSYEIQLKFGEDNVVTLSNTLAKGMNSVAWDGRDAYGKVVPAGTYNAADCISIKLKGGEVHFPLLDVESNFNGVKIERLAVGSAASGGSDATVYYNNSSSNAGDTSAPWSTKNWSVADRLDHSVSGVDTSGTTGASAYGAFAGDQVALDLWTYYGTDYKPTGYEFELKDVPTKVTVSKAWDHGANQSDVKPTSVQVQLCADNTPLSGAEYTVTLDDTTTQHTWSNLDPTKTYTVQELNAPSGYAASSTISGDNASGWTIALKNTYTGNIGKIRVVKKWVGSPPSDINVNVNVTGKDAAGNSEYTKSVKLEASSWSADINDLTDDEKALWFSAEEVVPAGYRQVSVTHDIVQENGEDVLVFTFTNEELRSLTVEKIWDDASDPSGRPAQIQMQLYKNDVAQGDPVSLSGTDSTWQYQWNDLLDDGSKYTVAEITDVPGYISSTPITDENGKISFTNTLATSVTVEKKWEGDADAAESQPVTVQLFKDGSVIDSCELSDANHWQHTWFDLSQNASYEVKEVAVDGFESSVVKSGAADGWTFEITNKAKTTTPDNPDNPDDNPDNPDNNPNNPDNPDNNPDNPNNPDTPGNPSGSTDPDNPGTTTASLGASRLASTGDGMWIGVLSLSGAACCAAACLLLLRRRS